MSWRKGEFGGSQAMVELRMANEPESYEMGRARGAFAKFFRVPLKARDYLPFAG